MEDVRRDDVGMQREADPRQPQAADLLDHYGAIEEVCVQPAVGFWKVRTQHSRLPCLAPELAIDMSLFFPLAVVRHGFFFEEGSYRVSKQFMLGTEQGSRDHGAPLVIVGWSSNRA
jgi:hypothetical protein